jgi:hypothetical protein
LQCEPEISFVFFVAQSNQMLFGVRKGSTNEEIKDQTTF